MSFAEYDALLTIAQAPGRRVRMGLLAEQVLLSKSGVTRLIDRLVNDGLVERSACSHRCTWRRGGPDRSWADPAARRVADPSARHQRALPRRRRDRRSRVARAGHDRRRPAGGPRRRRARALRPGRTRAPGPERRRLSGRVPGRLFAGTSGFAYPGWVPRFYPAGLPAKRIPGPLRGAARGRRAEQHLLRVAQAPTRSRPGSRPRRPTSGSRSRPSAADRSARSRSIPARASRG